MVKKMLIDATHAEETRVVVVDGNKVEEFDFESENKRQLAGNIYLAKVTRVEPSLQAAFVDYGGNRHGFLAFSEIHPDYYQIPVADRQALLEEEAAYAAAEEEEETPKKPARQSRSRSRSRSKSPQEAATPDAPSSDAVKEDANHSGETHSSGQISGMETIDLSDDPVEEINATGAAGEGLSPMERVHETPVADPDEISTEITPEAENPSQAQPDENTSQETSEETDNLSRTRPIAQSASDRDAVVTAQPSGDIAQAPEDTPGKMAEQAPEKNPEQDPGQDPEPAAPEQVRSADAGTQAQGDSDKSAPAEASAPEEEAKPAPRKRTRRAPRKTSKAETDTVAESVPEEETRDEGIESVADDDTPEDIRPARKPRPRRYKIQEVIKVRQIMLVQVVKEERGNKGAALTTYLSLAGRYCVLMPNTARGGGISRKITNAADRSKLKAIASEIDVPTGAGLIIRTAGANRTKTEIKRDYEYLQRLWEQIRELTLNSMAPAKIYEEGDLIKRSIRDLYSREIDEVLVEGEAGYRIAKNFMKMIMPSHAKNVKQYTDPMPLLARYQVESYLGGMFNPVVQLKSGGYIVIGVTEALVAIDVNSGRATKEGSIEETALKTNLEAAEEVARQLRLRDLAGLIVIDFIDMDERKNNAAVEKKIKDKLKTDRARIQVGRISGFGLLEMSRQRLRPGMIEATTQPCPACHGTGLVRSDENLALQVLRQIEEEGVRRRSREVLVRVPVGIANYLMNQKREHIAQIESRYGMAVRIEGDPHLVSPDFTLEKFKTATRAVPEASAPVISVDASLMEALDEETASAEEEEKAETAPTPEAPGEDKPKRKRRRRNRSRGRKKDEENTAEAEAETAGEGDKETSDADAAEQESAPDQPEKGTARKRTRTRSRGGASRNKSAETQEIPAEQAPVEEVHTQEPLAQETLTQETQASVPPPAPESPAEITPVVEIEGQTETPAMAEEKPKRTRAKASEIIAKAVGNAPEPQLELPVEDVPATEVEADNNAAPTEPAEPETPKPRRRGWWSLGRG